MRASSISDPCNPSQNVDTSIEKFEIRINAKVLDGLTAPNGKRFRFNLNQELTQTDTINAFDSTSLTVVRDLQGIMIHELGHAF